MNIFTGEDLKILIENKTPGVCACISIFMPTFRTGPDMQQGPSRLRNLLREAENKLKETGIRIADANKLIGPIRNVLNDAFFWQTQSDGLAIFSGPGLFRYYRVPVELKELVTVNERFQIKPLFPLLTGDGKFYILSVSQKGINLFQCTHFGYREVNLPDAVPSNFAEAMKYENLDRETQFHGHVGDTDYHGHIGMEAIGNMLTSHGRTITQERKDRLLRYFQQVDKGLNEIMRDEKAPLIFSGVDYLFPIYQQANTYANLSNKTIDGNPDRLSIHELHANAWDIVNVNFNSEKDKAIARYNTLKGTGLTSTDVKTIAESSLLGKIEILLLNGNEEKWGLIDQNTGTVSLHDRQEPCDEDILDFALTNTFIHGGTAYVLKADEMPGPDAADAVLRF